MSDLFCRHNRFTADGAICSKGTVLEKHTPSSAPRPRKPAKPKDPPAGKQFRGPYASAGPYERDDARVDVRLEKVPGGIRLAEWAAGALRPQAPVLPATDLLALVAQARERDLLPQRELERLEAAVGDGDVRIARWILRPGAGWELQDAPPMLPAARFAEALAAAARAGVM